MRQGYEAWFKDVSATRGYAPPRIYLGAAEENPSLLTRQDWRGPMAGWGPKSLGYWEVQVARGGTFDITVRFAPLAEAGQLTLTLGGISVTVDVARGSQAHTLRGVKVTDGSGRLEVEFTQGQDKVGPTYVEVTRRD
jgi:hypothetical protein